MLEGVGMLGEEARLVEELGGLEVRQATMEHRLGQLGNGVQQGQGHLGANDRSGLERCFSSGGSRSMRAASTACTVAGT